MNDFDKDTLKDSIRRDIHDQIHDEIHERFRGRMRGGRLRGRIRRDWDRTDGPFHGIIWGGIVCAVGIVLLLDHLGVISAGNLWRFWPLIVVVAGVVNLTQPGKLFWGALLIVVGVLFQLDSLHIIHFRWAELWPLAVIAAGLMMVWGSIESRRHRVSSPDAKNTMNATSVFGGVERRITAQDFRFGSVSAVFGGVELDFHGAEIDGEEAVMEVNVIFGGVEIRVPDHWHVEARNQPLFGGYSDVTRGAANNSGTGPGAGSGVGPTSSKKTLVITGQVLFGGIEVKN
jgi:predicted membrane protein